MAQDSGTPVRRRFRAAVRRKSCGIRPASPAAAHALGFRLRYEIWRKFGPYVGVSFDWSFFDTADLVRADGGDPSQVRFVAGVRAWR